MMITQPTLFVYLVVLLIICTFIQQSYQQTAVTTNKDLTFCIKNHKMSNTLQTFWHDVNSDCELDAIRLVQLYSQLLEESVGKEDKCLALLKHKIRKKLIQVVSNELEEALIMQSTETNGELKQVLKNLQEIDERATQLIWERVINAVHWFVAPEQMIHEIVQFKVNEIQFMALESLFNKYSHLDSQLSETIIPLLTFHINSLLKSKTSTALFLKTIQRLYHRLPKELRFLLLSSSSSQRIGLLNYHQFEYLYAPRDNGPDSERRLALTWIQTKNSTDSDGHLQASFNDKGLVAFGSHFGASLKYLYADVEYQTAYFWIGSGVKASQWWQILWPHQLNSSEVPGYILLRNDVTKELLCATMEYDENRRYVTVLNAAENMENPSCYWLISRL